MLCRFIATSVAKKWNGEGEAMAEGKFVAYCRVSTKGQGQSGLGLEAQQKAISAYLNGGQWSLIAEYVEVESGKKSNRPELLKALAACRVHKATLIIAKLDRLARNASFLMGLVDSSIDFVFCDFPNIPAGATGRFMTQQMASFAELEAGLISERTKAALRAKVARDGQWDRKAAHHLVAGAGQAAASAQRHTQAQQQAADLSPIVEEIRLSGIVSLRGIGQALGERGIAAPSGGEWGASTVRRLLARLAA